MPFLFLVLLLLLSSCCAPFEGDEEPLVFEGVGVVDVESGRVLPNRTVVITGDRITAEGPSEELRPPWGARVVEGGGRFLIPGLWDMHVHLATAGRSGLGLLVANGVTRIRDMGGSLDTIGAYREAVKSGNSVGPWIVAAGDIVENGDWLARVSALPIPTVQRFLAENPRIPVSTAEEARAAVDSLSRRGADFVKVRTLPPDEAFQVLTAEARRHGLGGVASHVPEHPDGLRYAAEMGLSSIEHLDILSFLLDSLRAGEREERYTAMAEAGVAFTPTVTAGLVRTLGRGTVGSFVEDTFGVADPYRPYLSQSLLSFWRLQQEMEEFEEPRPWSELLARDLTYVKEMHDSGVRILAGTDLGVRLLYPGFSLHEELRLLVEAVGLSPGQALRAATAEPARFFEGTDTLGSVSVGRVADLVLLEGNPLEDIWNTTRIAAVVLRGKYLDRRELDDILAGTRRPIH